MSWNTIERTDHDNGIVRISLDDPETHNAQSLDMLTELNDVIKNLDSNRDNRVLILDGNGPSFSSGHDLEVIERDWKGGDWSARERLAWENKYFWEPFWNLRDLGIPTIAQVHGHCGAAGLMMASPCDLIMAAEDAEFFNPVNRMAANGVEILLEPWEVGVRKAKELLWTGDSITGSEAENLGMANHAVPEEELHERTITLARKIAEMPPFAIHLSKKSLNFTLDEMGQRKSYEYHYMAHHLAHNSNEWRDWHEEAGQIAMEEGIREFIKHRDEPFEQHENK